MEKSNFDDLLERYLRNELSEKERIKIEAWLDSRKTTAERNVTWNKEDEERLFRKITGKAFGMEEITPTGGIEKTKYFLRPWMAIAAGVALIAIFSYAIWSAVGSATEQIQFTSADQDREVVLADGSIVWLRPHSTLTWIRTGGSVRRAELTGEALFEIAKDPAHPFSIRCGEVIATVRGTSFTLMARKGHLELNVLTGKVHLSSTRDTAGIDVLPLERVVSGSAFDIAKKSFARSEVVALTAGTEYAMEFQNSPMDLVLDKIGKKFKVIIDAENPSLKKCRITADFTDRSLESTLQMLSELLELSYTIKGTTVSIIGKGCS